MINTFHNRKITNAIQVYGNYMQVLYLWCETDYTHNVWLEFNFDFARSKLYIRNEYTYKGMNWYGKLPAILAQLSNEII